MYRYSWIGQNSYSSLGWQFLWSSCTIMLRRYCSNLKPIRSRMAFEIHSQWGISGALVYHPIMRCFCSKKDLYLCFQEQKNRSMLSCIEHIYKMFSPKNTQKISSVKLGKIFEKLNVDITQKRIKKFKNFNGFEFSRTIAKQQ